MPSLHRRLYTAETIERAMTSSMGVWVFHRARGGPSRLLQTIQSKRGWDLEAGERRRNVDPYLNASWGGVEQTFSNRGRERGRGESLLDDFVALITPGRTMKNLRQSRPRKALLAMLAQPAHPEMRLSPTPWWRAPLPRRPHPYHVMHCRNHVAIYPLIPTMST